MNIYPSPASNKITIENYSEIDKGIISIFSANGQLILYKSIFNRKTELDISYFAKGLYFVKLTADKGNALNKFIKE
jgi:hypothetical protein